MLTLSDLVNTLSVRVRSLVLLSTALDLGVPRRDATAQVPTPIRQTVEGVARSSRGETIPDANVIITMGPVRVSKATRSDSVGRFAVQFDSATGDYLVFASAVGFGTVRKRVTSNPRDPSVSVQIVLSPATAANLDTVKVSVALSRPSANVHTSGSTTGASLVESDGVVGALSADEIGNLSALALNTPGVALSSGGISVLGLPSTQNAVTVDGAAFSGGRLPRAAEATHSVVTSVWDPSRGGFAGAEVATGISAGSPFETRRAFLSVVPQPLSTSLGVPAALAPLGSAVRASLGRSGEVIPDLLFAQIALDVSAKTNRERSLLDASDDALRELGMSVAAREDLMRAAGERGIPMGRRGHSNQGELDATLLARFDWGGYDYRRSVERRSGWNLSVIASSHARDGQGVGAWSTPSVAMESQRTNGFVKLESNRQVGRTGRYIASVNADIATDLTTPRFALPLVRVQSQPTVGSQTNSQSLALGGGGTSRARRDEWNVEARNTFIWNRSGETKHRRTLYAWARIAGAREQGNNGTPGTFTYRSLEEFEAARPATYSRTLQLPSAQSVTWNGAASIGESWRVNNWIRVLGGLRLEGNAFLGLPVANPMLSSALGVFPQLAPRALGMSPRIGVSWIFDRRRNNTPTRLFNGLGQFAYPASRQLRFGIGEFRSLFLPVDGLEPSIATGLPNGALWLQCLGDAVPDERWPAWDEPSQFPARCRDGSGAFADASPRVSTFDRRFRPARSWRSSIGWNAGFAGFLRYAIDATWSLQFDQPGWRDANFAGRLGFRLASEGNRPVFAPTESIDTATGLIAPPATRRVTDFGVVSVRTSERRGGTSAYSLTLSPQNIGAQIVRLSYTYSDGWLKGSGFDQPTQGDPRGSVSSPAVIPRHMARAEVGRVFLNGQLNVSGLVRVQSGWRFTPLASQDINGDGLVNDAAFIPAAASLTSALASTSGSLRRCVLRQAGRIAGIGSCDGPWQVTSNLHAAFTPRRARASGVRWHAVSLNLSNPLGGLDYLLHGESTRGWGNVAIADPVLLLVTGFDPASRQYRYAVNPRFGASHTGLSRFVAPVRATIEVTVGLEPHPDLQQLRRSVRTWKEGEDRVRPNIDELVRRYRRQVPDPYGLLLADPDSLFLTINQMRTLTEAQVRYVAAADSGWRELAQYIVALDPSRIGFRDTDRVDRATQDGWRRAHVAAEQIVSTVLKPGQVEIASRGTLLALLRWNESVRFRVYRF